MSRYIYQEQDIYFSMIYFFTRGEMSCSSYKYVIYIYRDRFLKNHGRWDQDFLVKMGEGDSPYRVGCL